jgi:hypothetical protein
MLPQRPVEAVKVVLNLRQPSIRLGPERTKFLPELRPKTPKIGAIEQYSREDRGQRNSELSVFVQGHLL